MLPFYYHIQNYTTYEFITKVIRRGKESSDKEIYLKEVSRYGFIHNFVQIMGDNPLLGLIPINSSSNSLSI